MEKKEQNRSKTYFIPLLNDYLNINLGLLINTYLFDVNRPELNVDLFKGLFLHFRWSNNEISRMYEQDLLNSPYVKEHYDVDSESYMVYVSFPADIIIDAQKIFNGKFSKITDESKSKIVRYWPGTNANTELYGVLFRTALYKKKLEERLDVKIPENNELGAVFNMHDETFNKVIKELVIK